MVIALAGLGLVVVNALAESPWGTFTVGFTIPLALLMGLYMYRFRKGKIAEASIIGIIGLMFAVWLGGRIAESSLAETFTLSRNSLILIMAAYGFIASVLPVWMLLCPRDYLSSYLKIGTIAFLIIGVIVVAPNLNMPAFTPFTAGGGPGDSRQALSVCLYHDRLWRDLRFPRADLSGTTPKMIAKETDTRMIGYGSMLMEGVVGVVALIAAASLFPGDYFAINTAQRTEATEGRLRAHRRYAHRSKASTCNHRRSIDSNRNQARRTCADAPAAPSRSHSASRKFSTAFPASAA